MGYTSCIKCNAIYFTSDQDGKHIPSTNLLIENHYCSKCRGEFIRSIKKR
ncbi:hypothetical protein CSC2_06020 [Clostridium zeae]|uniref:Uncharacterized protein n=1 Tax=Clostridium zeae TaxID=2759022 RepID=A0ABQ1E5Q3_9CLOT|nr:hypothetical protein CSC2_06020 [Clostridium zeae]